MEIMENNEFMKLITYIANKHQYMPEGNEKKEVWKIICRAADIIDGKVYIEKQNDETNNTKKKL